jgi:TolB-like protein
MRLWQINSLACATMFLSLVLGGAAASSGATKVLVLPPHSVGEPGHYDWIAQAVAEDLQSEARQNPNVQVLSAPSATIDATSAAAQAAGNQAGADITIFGSYQVVSDMLRINCTAIDAGGKTLASPAATGAVRDLFVIEDKLAAEINRILPPRPGMDAAAAAPAPAPYTYVNPGAYSIPGVTDSGQPTTASAAQPDTSFYYPPSTPYVYYLPEYSIPPVYYPEAPSYCYTTWEPFYDDLWIGPGLTFYGGVGYGGGIDRGRGRFGNVGVNGGGLVGGRSAGTAGRSNLAGGIRAPLPPWGGTPTPLGFHTVPLNAAGNNIAHLNTAPLGALGGRR